MRFNFRIFLASILLIFLVLSGCVELFKQSGVSEVPGDTKNFLPGFKPGDSVYENLENKLDDSTDLVDDSVTTDTVLPKDNIPDNGGSLNTSDVMPLSKIESCSLEAGFREYDAKLPLQITYPDLEYMPTVSINFYKTKSFDELQKVYDKLSKPLEMYPKNSTDSELHSYNNPLVKLVENTQGEIGSDLLIVKSISGKSQFTYHDSYDYQFQDRLINWQTEAEKYSEYVQGLKNNPDYASASQAVIEAEARRLTDLSETREELASQYNDQMQYRAVVKQFLCVVEIYGFSYDKGVYDEINDKVISSDIEKMKATLKEAVNETLILALNNSSGLCGKPDSLDPRVEGFDFSYSDVPENAKELKLFVKFANNYTPETLTEACNAQIEYRTAVVPTGYKVFGEVENLNSVETFPIEGSGKEISSLP
ncbi:MAG: hypothetical protein Q7K42_06170, partial [Candidatus Diapherotrites archaeon]|nr:hypothetical protein [Candidatus Diapherotrites archaeon]